MQGYFAVQEESAWEAGKGKDLAREMLLGSKKSPLLEIKDPTDSDSDPESV